MVLAIQRVISQTPQFLQSCELTVVYSILYIAVYISARRLFTVVEYCNTVDAFGKILYVTAQRKHLVACKC